MLEIIAHRGGSDVAPENTLAAILSAVETGVPEIELDLQKTQDGKWIVFHDRSLKRIAANAGKISKLRLDQLKEFDVGSWCSAKFANERVPTLQEAAKLIPTNHVLTLDLKFTNWDPVLLSSLYKELRQYNLVNHVRLASPDVSLLRYLRRTYPKIILVGLTILPPIRVDLWPVDILCVHWTSLFIYPLLTRHVHKANKRIYVGIVNSPRLARVCQLLRVDGLVTDYPIYLLQTLRNDSAFT